MTDYTITTNFGAKDSLPSGNAGKVIKGSEFTTEFTNIQTAVNSKADTAGDTFTGVVNFSDDVAVNTNTLFVDASTGAVGIGTTNPQRALHVESEVRIQGTYPKLEFHDTDNNPKFTLIGGNAQLQFYDETNATTRMSITASGNVGIGTTSPVAKLHIDSGATDEVLRLEGTGSPYLSFYDTGVRQSYIGSTGNTLEIHGDTPDTNIALYTANTERLRIDSSGNVLVNTTSSDPAFANVEGIALSTNFIASSRTSNPALFLNRKSTDGTIAEFKKDGTTVGAIGTASGGITFASGSTITERMRIDSSGNVGIGTNSPTTTLDVAGTGTFTTLYVNSTNNSNLYLQNSNVGTSNLNFAEGDGTAQPIVNGKIEYNHSNETLDIKNKNNLALRVKDNGEIEFGESIGLNLATSGQTISDGHLYIHIDNAQKAALKVNNGQGSPSQFKLFESNKNEIMVKENGEIAFQTEGEGGFRFDENAFQPAGSTNGLYVSDMFTTNTNTTADLGTATNRWNRIYLNNQPNVPSDQRLKENISDADDAGSTIDAIQVRKFDWIKDGTHQSYGMIAQELAEVYPEAVSVPENDEDTLGIAYADLIPMLIKEVQSLRSRVAELESE